MLKTRFTSIRSIACLVFGFSSIVGSVQASESAAILSSEFIYDSGPYPQIHATTIAETPTGLVAAWFGGTHEKNPDVCIWVSRFVSGKWTTSVETANGIQPDGSRHPTWNPVLFQPHSGPTCSFTKWEPPGLMVELQTSNRRRIARRGVFRPASRGFLGQSRTNPIQEQTAIFSPTSERNARKTE